MRLMKDREVTQPSFVHPLNQALDMALLWLCSIPSPIGEEKEICDAVVDRLEKVSLAAKIRRYSNSIVVPLARGQEEHQTRPKVALVGHLDTVRTENGPAHLQHGRCYGAGASDMKSGLAVMLVLAETIDPTALGCDLSLVFYAREEGPYEENELGHVLDWDPELGGVDLAVCMEPSDNRLHLGCNGSLHATVTFEGKTGHSARPWEGENAISKAAPFLGELAARKPKERVIDGLKYRTVTTVTQAKDGGRGRNVVPDKFVLNVNHRFSPDTGVEEAKGELIELVGGRAKVEFVDVSPAAMPNREHPLVRKLVEAGVKAVEPKQAWTDVARLAARGVAAVNFGPGENAQAHQRNESTSCTLVHEAYVILRRWLVALGSAALIVALAGCGSCSKDKEPKKGDFDPASASAAAKPRPGAPSEALPTSTIDAAAFAGMSPIEKKSAHVRITNEQCEQAAKHANIVSGRKDTDPKGIGLIASCLRFGNVAWYVCVDAAKSEDDVKSCNLRLLQPPESLP
jgi:succinyl-diaminopimelate desuccinylase